MITIASKKEGFRRCGVAHSQTQTSYPNDRFSEADLKALQDEPMLVVTISADPEESKETKGKTNKGKDDNPPDGGNT